jgi:hypothetical protein
MFYIRLFGRKIEDKLCLLFLKDYRKQDRVAAEIAARYNMSRAYKMARNFGLTPMESLDENDLLTEENYHLLMD